MSANYSGDLSADIGKLRLALGDSDIFVSNAGAKPDGSNFSDDELNVFIELSGSWKRAVSVALRSLANQYARQAVVQEIDGYKEDLSKIAVQLQDAATKWDAQLEKLAALTAADAANAAVSWADCFGFDDGVTKQFGMAQYGA